MGHWFYQGWQIYDPKKDKNRARSAETFLQEHPQISHFYDDKTNQMVCFSSDVQKAMIKFAKLHVKVALETAVQEAKMYDANDVENPVRDEEGNEVEDLRIDKESILNCYPDELVK